jgi:hypothetical protein
MRGMFGFWIERLTRVDFLQNDRQGQLQIGFCHSRAAPGRRCHRHGGGLVTGWALIFLDSASISVERARVAALTTDRSADFNCTVLLWAEKLDWRPVGPAPNWFHRMHAEAFCQVHSSWPGPPLAPCLAAARQSAPLSKSASSALISMRSLCCVFPRAKTCSARAVHPRRAQRCSVSRVSRSETVMLLSARLGYRDDSKPADTPWLASHGHGVSTGLLTRSFAKRQSTSW